MTEKQRVRLRAIRRAVIAMCAAFAVSAGGLLVLPGSAAYAASGTTVSLSTTTAATQAVGSRFDYTLSWACSASGSTSCEGIVVEVPVTLQPRAGQIEDLHRWAFEATLPDGSRAGFTRSVQQQGNTATLRFTATRPVPAGVQESILLSVRPHAATGDGIAFTVGEARVTVQGGAPSTAPAISGTVTNQDLPVPSVRVISGGEDPSGRGLVHYEILPNFDRVYDPVSGAWQPWRAISSPATLTTVTAIDGTETIRVPLPAGATAAAIAAGGSYDAQANAIVWTAGSGLGNSPLQFTLSYDPGINQSVVELSLERSFTETNGDQNHASVVLPHRLQLVPNVTEPEFTKCGQGSVNGKANERVNGQCQNVNYVTLVPKYSVDAGDWLQYKLSATKLEAGDQLRVTDWAPCRTTPVSGGYGSEAGCTDPLAWFTGMALEARTAVSGSASVISVLDANGNVIERIGGGTNSGTVSQLQALTFVELELFRSDGQSVTLYNTTQSPTFPTLPAGVHYIGFSGVTTPLQFPGIVSLIPRMQISPTIDRAMTLQNTAEWNLTRYGQEGSTVSSTGAAAIVEGVSGRTEASLLAPTGNTRSLRGVFQAYSLDPADGLPVYLLELPEGYEPQGGDLSSVRLLHGSQQVPLSMYDLTYVPEDRAAGLPPMIRAVPRTGGAAVPSGANSGWPLVTLLVNVAPLTAASFGQAEARSWISVNGANTQLDRCATQSNAVFVEGDAADRDGDGVYGEDRFCRSGVTRMTYPATGAAVASVAVKEVRDASSAEWVGGNGVASTPSGVAEYRLHWENAGTEALSDVVLYDILPHPGDVGSVTATANVARGSAFAPEFTGLTSAVPAGTTLYYSSSSNPCRPEVAQLAQCDNDWTTDLASIGAAQVRALKVTLPGARPTGSGYNLYYEMRVPAGTASGVNAWNTLASHALHQGSPLAPAETAKVGITMPAEVTVTKESPAAGRTVAVGDRITYTLRATNELTSVANGVTLTDDLSGVLSAADFGGDEAATTGTVSFDEAQQRLRWEGSLQPGDTVIITYSVLANSPGEIVNRVTGSIGELPTNCQVGDEDGCSVETVVHQPALSIAKRAVGVQSGDRVEANTTLQWEYRVRNEGTEPIGGLAVADDRGVAVSCPSTVLAVGAAMTCSGSGSVGTASPYVNVGTVTGAGTLTGASVSAQHSWSAELIPLTTTLTLDKFAADVAEGSVVDAEQQVTWTYRVTNTGTDRLTNLTVTDDQGVTVSCPVTELDRGASTDCTGTGQIGLFGPYQNVGTATAIGLVTAGIATGSDSWSVPVDPYETGVVIEKTAPEVTGHTVRPGTVVEWRYTVTNIGEEDLRHVVVSDDQGVVVSCPSSTLAAGADMVCTGSASVGTTEGEYSNVGTVVAETVLTGTPVEHADTWSIEVRELVPALTIVKGATNARAGESTPAMHEVEWQYTVTNTGEDRLTDLSVSDDQGVIVTCPSTELAQGASLTCTGSGSVGAGERYTNIATASGTGELSGLPARAEHAWSVPIEAAELGLVVVKSAQQLGTGEVAQVNQEVTWDYVVTNTGREPITALAVTDDQGVNVVCADAEIAPYTSVSCVGTGSVGAGPSYTNIGTATGSGLWTDRAVTGEDTWSVAVVTPISGGADPVPTAPSADGATGQPLAVTGSAPGTVVTILALAAGMCLLAGGCVMLGRRAARRHTGGNRAARG